MAWPELLDRQADVLQQYESWLLDGCVGAPPATLDVAEPPDAVPMELRRQVADLAARTTAMEQAVAVELARLRDRTGHPAPPRTGYEARPIPRYLDAMG